MAETLTTLLTNITAVVTAAFEWVVTAGEAIAGNAILFLFVVAVPLVGLGVGLWNRLVRSN